MRLVELLIDDETEFSGIQAVSLVEYPAIEENFVYFSRDRFVLAKADEEKRMLIGPALIPDKKIPRIDEDGEEYEVFFSHATVEQAAQRYMREERTNQHTYEHMIDIEGVTVVESWIIADSSKDKASLYGFSLPEGTWMLAMKIHNDEVWNAVKNREVRGFSIEGYFVDLLVNAKAHRPVCPDCPKDAETLKELRRLVFGEMKPVDFVDGEPVWATPEEATLYGELFKNCVGYHEHDGGYMACESHPGKVEFESYSDYPKAVSNNAKRGIELNEKVNNKCATQTGKVRAQQLANGEPISEETISRMYSFLSRHESNYDESDTEACGTISYLLWGGKAGLKWAGGKLRELDLIE